jgi:diguanylate cyclase (GGDEF)-like protein
VRAYLQLVLRSWRLALAALGLGLVYAGLVKLVDVQSSFSDGTGAAVFWPAAGVTVSVLILRPRREWPAYLAAIWISDALMSVESGAGVAVSIGYGAANALAPALSAALIARWLGDTPDLSQQRDLGVFLLAAACAGPLAGATLGSLWAGLIEAAPLWPRSGRWFVGDQVGVLIVAPLIISFARPAAAPLLKFSEGWTFAVLAAALAIVMPWHWSAQLGLPFFLIGVLGLVGMRMGTRAAAAGVFAVGVLVETLTAADRGPFATGGGFSGLIVAQAYLLTCAVSSLTAAALMTGLVRRDQLALHDGLTGLANRRLLLERLGQARKRLARNRGTIALAYADLDGFKAINDVHGHAAGDEVLVATAKRLTAAVRANDTVARLGGDEFVVLLDGVADDAALEQLLGRLETAVEEPIVLADETPVRVGCSLGCAVVREPGEGSEEILERADRAMYEIKRSRHAGVPAPPPGHRPALLRRQSGLGDDH